MPTQPRGWRSVILPPVFDDGHPTPTRGRRTMDAGLGAFAAGGARVSTVEQSWRSVRRAGLAAFIAAALVLHAALPGCVDTRSERLAQPEAAPFQNVILGLCED